MHASSEQFLVKLNYVERGLSRLCGGHGEIPQRFYDVTSWSYVNLDDPYSIPVSRPPPPFFNLWARPALRRFSIPECWAGAGNEATLVSRGYLSSCSSSTPCFLLCPGLTQPVLYLLCCFNSVPGAVSRSILPWII